MNLKNKIFISLNGDLRSGFKPDLSVFKETIAVDGGARFFEVSDEIPDVLIGDLDSVSDNVLKEFRDNGVKILKFPAKKDLSDFELAINYIKERYSHADITIVGFYSNDRIDHFLFNIEVLKRLKGYDVKIISKTFIMYLLNRGKHELGVDKGCTISMLPISQEVLVDDSEGFEYPLKEEHLIQGSSLSLSNITKTSRILLKIREGQLLVLIPKEKI
ncbi:MAG: thiamine diphosphokinase [Candidatus Muiribacterium halophilum]|uniref:Thiamine diphosphokinase n=1 Tax=Muiribacterium halophilum TaxID=2053465 RepID=A0A2N5ZBX3_MUIH1|nr:MAG: thiamine diphosphokinase [Candidatus Muirbacterium halophilum]